MKKKLAKTCSAAVAALISLTMLAGCGNSKTQPEVTSETTPAVTEPPTVLAEIKCHTEIPELAASPLDIPDNDAMKFVKDMRLGWNLGNTFDAVDDSGSIANDLDLESAWVGTKTTRSLIDNVKNAGFNTVRVPVSWHNHIDSDFNINEPFMDRVQQVVDYVIDNDMYCIINIHHDNDAKYFYPNSENLESSEKYVAAIWSQVAERFKDYDEKLIFEGLNEPRLVGTNVEWWLNPNDPKCVDSVNVINRLMQVFTDTVRASGGNNANRYLMIPGYDASADGALNDGYALPNDTADNKLIVSVHAYTPYNFALQGPTENGSTDVFDINSTNSTGQITSFMDNLYNKFVSKGIPVVIGEFGARNKNNNSQARTDFAAFYILTARERGITCCWWDNNAFFGNGENFGLFHRDTSAWRYGEIAIAMDKYAD